MIGNGWLVPDEVAFDFERTRDMPIIWGPRVRLYPQPSATKLEGDEAEKAKDRRYRRATHRARKG